jgi:8-oxo-dGTP diphosphatase
MNAASNSCKPTRLVALALVQRDGKWLVTRRRRDVHLPGLWEFPGGKRDPGETPPQAALRELVEECGVCAQAVRALPAVSCEYEDRIVHLTPIVCRWVSGEPRPIEVDECRWLDKATLGALCMPAVNAEIIARLPDQT